MNYCYTINSNCYPAIKDQGDLFDLYSQTLKSVYTSDIVAKKHLTRLLNKMKEESLCWDIEHKMDETSCSIYFQVKVKFSNNNYYSAYFSMSEKVLINE